jgi:hypothetical protein
MSPPKSPSNPSRAEEEVQKLLTNLPLLELVCNFEPVSDRTGADDFEELMKRRLARVKAAHLMIEQFKRRL